MRISILSLLALLSFSILETEATTCIMDRTYTASQTGLLLSVPRSYDEQCKEWLFGSISETTSMEFNFRGLTIDCTRDSLVIYNEDKTKVVYDVCQNTKSDNSTSNSQTSNVRQYTARFDLRYAFVRAHIRSFRYFWFLVDFFMNNPSTQTTPAPTTAGPTFPTTRPTITTTQQSSINLTCGIQYFPQTYAESRIVGGVEAAEHSWPWQAKISDGNYLCGASLISPDWAITAAHCVSDVNSFNRLTPMKPSDLTVYLGEHNLLKKEPTEQAITASSIFIYNTFTGLSRDYYQGDIALIKLSRPAILTTSVQPICLPEQDQIIAPRNTFAFVTGWGKTGRYSASASVLNQVGINVVANYDCSGVDSTKICAGAPGHDSCNGDSGGPLQVKRGSQYYLAGIVSYGSTDCNENGVYTRVSSYRSWIKSITGI